MDDHGIRLDHNYTHDLGHRASATASNYQNIIITELVIIVLKEFFLAFYLFAYR